MIPLPLNSLPFVRAMPLKVNSLAFQPGNPKVIASSSGRHKVPGASIFIDSAIIIWDLDGQQLQSDIDTSAVSRAVNQAVDVAARDLSEAEPAIKLSNTEREALISDLETNLSHIVRNHESNKKSSL
jgi:hypothetical protein